MTTKQVASAILALTFAVAPAAARSQSSAAREQETPRVDLGWMSGCWELRRPSGVRVEESWTAPRAGLMLGTSRTTRPVPAAGRDTLLEYEMLVLRERGDSIVLTAHPSGQAAASFRADTVRAGLVSFANPAHDFPQRVRYAAVGADTLAAAISGPGRDGATRTVRFRYARVHCPAGGER